MEEINENRLKKLEKKIVQIEKGNKSPNRIWKVNERIKKKPFLRSRCKIAIKNRQKDFDITLYFSKKDPLQPFKKNLENNLIDSKIKDS